MDAPILVIGALGNVGAEFVNERLAARVLTEEGHAGNNYDPTGAEALDDWQVAKILRETLRREITYRNPGALTFLLETLRLGASFRYALVIMGLYTSTKYGMAEAITNQVERLIGQKPISFKQYTEDDREAWL